MTLEAERNPPPGLIVANPDAVDRVLGAAGNASGDGVFPKGDVFFGRYLGEGWVDVFVLSVVAVVVALSFVSLRKFWAGLQSTVPAGTPRLPLAGALRSTLVDVFTH